MCSESFTYTASDGITDVTSSLEVSVQGSNDAPILVAPLADQDFTFNKAFSWKMPAGSFADLDKGDALTYTATLADGSALPDWLTFDAATQTISGFTPKQVGSIDIRVTATDKVAANGSTHGRQPLDVGCLPPIGQSRKPGCRQWGGCGTGRS